jgi:hypothetical protein
LVIGGYFSSTVDFNPGPGVLNITSSGNTDIFVLKLNSTGNLIWAKTVGGSSSDVCNSLKIDGLGNIYSTGWFQGTVDFDPGFGTSNLTSFPSLGIYIQKLSSSGNFLWAKYSGAFFDDGARALHVDASGNVYTTGFFNLTVDFNPGPGLNTLTSVGGEDVFIQKLNPSGTFVWAKSYGGAFDDEGTGIVTDNSGNVFTIGTFNGTVDFDPGPGVFNLTSVGSVDIFIQKLDASGNFVWAKSMGGQFIDRGLGIALDNSGNVYNAGYFESTVDFDPGMDSLLFTSTAIDLYIQKLDSVGDLVWVRTIGGYSNDQAEDISVDDNGNIYITGIFSSIVDFDPGTGVNNLASAGFSDIFTHKMSSCVISQGTDVVTACDSFTWIDGNTYTSSNNSAKVILISSTGCDSVLTLDLTITTSDTVNDVITACNSYTWIDGSTYTTSTNNITYTLTNNNGCDSVLVLDLTIDSVTDLSTSLSGITITASNANADYQWLDCNNNFSIINGETNQSFTPSTNGTYAVELTENGCVDTSACVTVTTVGMNELVHSTSLIVYPNPTSGLVEVSSSAILHEAQVLVTDILGRVVFEKYFDRLHIAEINLADNPNGIYLLTLRTPNGETTIRIAKHSSFSE